MAGTIGPNIVTSGLVLSLDASNSKSFRGEPTTNLLSNPTNEVIGTSSEFVQYADLAPIFNTYGTSVTYSLSLDLKSAVAGSMLVYMQNGSSTKYSFVSNAVNATTTYQRFNFDGLHAAISTPTDTAATLAFYGTYGSGRIPSIKNVQVEIKDYATPFVNGTRGSTPATGGGWLDLSGSNNGELVNGPTYSSANGGGIVFNGSNNCIDLNTNNIITGTNPFTIECFFTLTSGSYGELFGNYGAGYSSGYVWFATAGLYINGSCYVPNYGSVTQGTHYLASSRDSGGNCITYLDGIAVAWSNLSASIPVGLNFRMGSDVNGYSELLNGKIYNIKVYNRVLSGTEIIQNFNSTKSKFGL